MGPSRTADGLEAVRPVRIDGFKLDPGDDDLRAAHKQRERKMNWRDKARVKERKDRERAVREDVESALLAQLKRDEARREEGEEEGEEEE